MRREQFGTWLGKYPGKSKGSTLNYSTIYTHLTRLKEVEEKEYVDLDNEFKKDSLAGITARFHDTPQSTALRNMRINPVALPPIRSQLKKYREFCEKHPPK